jgi:hypothetical protein
LIRKQVYDGEEPRKNKLYEAIKRVFRLYKKDRDGNPVLDKDGNKVEFDKVTLQIRCTGKRAAYQKAKRDYKEARIYGSTMRSL